MFCLGQGPGYYKREGDPHIQVFKNTFQTDIINDVQTCTISRLGAGNSIFIYTLFLNSLFFKMIFKVCIITIAATTWTILSYIYKFIICSISKGILGSEGVSMVPLSISYWTCVDCWAYIILFHSSYFFWNTLSIVSSAHKLF